ncbi:MAG: 3-oxoacyl-[acyl-carrier protein] reductase [Candidatus Atribacteria bacterium]|jgi:NAD(P)-dependent dehydrogenase (short-subunit alcohol dehydrogenase family)|nr:3-oxoacyl-[acyl-carrier protein] reductase [Candidatus Atribacteria bacterium]
MRLKDKVVIVTGGGQGLGEAFAKGCAKEGAKVVITDVNEKNGQKVQQEIGESALFIRTDVSSRQEVQAMVDEAMKRFGKIDVLINNAGIHSGGKFWEETEETWRRIFEVNVLGVVFCSQAVVPIMMKQGKGKIINVSSKAAIVGEPFHAAYSASKGAVLSLTRAMAAELAPYKINVNALCPGTTLTPLGQSALEDPELRKALESGIPLGRLGQPEDHVGSVLFLASDESDWMTGQMIVVDGGLSMI